MKRRGYIALRIALLIGIGVVAAILIDRAFKPTWNPEGLAKIELGMTLEEVQALLGGPPGDYCREQVTVHLQFRVKTRIPPNSRTESWFDEVNRVEVYFDADNRVVGMNERFQWTRHERTWLDPYWDALVNFIR